MRWTPERGWFVWDGRCWQVDDLGRVMVKARETVEAIFDEIRKANDKDAIFRWAKRSQSAKAIKDMLYLSRSDPRITARLADFDADPWILTARWRRRMEFEAARLALVHRSRPEEVG